MKFEAAGIQKVIGQTGALPAFTLRQVGQGQQEMFGIPRPGPKGDARKNHKALVFSWIGRALLLGVPIGLVPCRGALPGARWARRLLRKPAELSGEHFFPIPPLAGRASPLGPGVKLASLAD